MNPPSDAGHPNAALLVDDLCSDDHIHMRWCRAGEEGAVVSPYKGIDGYNWLAMPPGPYMFAVDSADEVPTAASIAEGNLLRAEYRIDHPGSFEHDPPDDAWIQLLGASYRRRIVCIHLRTTAAQDERLMQWLNRGPDRTHFNFFFSNCADFARQMLDVLFPRAVHRNLLFDLGMTTPKQLESSLHHYAMWHPELGFELYELSQVPGNIPRSGRLYGVTESLVKSKPYLFPVAVLAGLGVETARTLVAHGADVVGAARDLEKAKRATAEVSMAAAANGASLELIELDLASLKSVRPAADKLVADGRLFNVLIANAGVMMTPLGKTEDGFESQLGTNHRSHFVFVNHIAVS